ncbi:helix-turn-helix transcriptional regulator [Tenggerimyces flavus]|uniref:LuxR C-terminal-related transcriptional regulator n=1 Tax=Tenggerimyces flavus TaxID=1708749 RepID=A0ABV7YHV9_9ACTN|nr:helix-turn-helix transcriptional regulator [Tenggerimyces flavus]MBM7789857.1 DNA-binding CsgD family transcriptional regulator [Tenggerimyces flavus]
MATLQVARKAVTKLVSRGLGPREFASNAASALRRFVPYEGACLLTLDPATLLPTGEYVENGLPPSTRTRLLEIELLDHDVNKFAALARTTSTARAASLSAATQGDLDRSLRHREVRKRYGLDDELRAMLVDGSGTWGALTLMRTQGQPRFTKAEVDLVATLAGDLAQGLQRAARTNAPHDDSVGVLTVTRDGTKANHAAKRWLDELSPVAVDSVVYQARSTGDAYARARTEQGTWLALRATQHDHAVTVTIQPAQANELAPLIADAYGLTARERAITELIAQGHATNEIATQLHLSPYTVQDHLKVIFDKTSTKTRGELVARIFFEHYAPRL